MWSADLCEAHGRKQWSEADRNFVSISVSELIGLTRDRTDFHAGTLIRPFLGKRIAITGNFRNATYIFGIVGMAFIDCGNENVVLHLTRWNVKSFVPLPAGTVITIRGRIKEVERLGLHLQNVEIIPTPPESLQSHTPVTRDIPQSQAQL